MLWLDSLRVETEPLTLGLPIETDELGVIESVLKPRLTHFAWSNMLVVLRSIVGLDRRVLERGCRFANWF